MKLLLSIILGLSLYLPAFAEENLNTNNNDDALATTDTDANAATDTHEIVLSGKSDKDVEALVNNFYYNFGRTLLFTTRSTSFTLRNRGFVPILINSIRIRGYDFYQRENCPQFLFFGQRCTVRVFFRPTFIGNYQGILSINLSGAEDVRVFLYGRGVFSPF